MSEPVRFFVRGKPEPAGSKTNMPRGIKSFPFVVTSFKHLMAVYPIVDANKNAAGWKKTVAAVAQYEMAGRRILEGPLGVRFVFHFERPAGHLLTDGRSLSSSGRKFNRHTKAPDVLKLARAVEDAMTGTVYVDDSQIIDEHLRKAWSYRTGVEVLVWSLLDEPDDEVEGYGLGPMTNF